MDMATTAPTRGGGEGQRGIPEDTGPGADAGEGGPCGILGQIEDERLQLMGLLVRTHRQLTETLGRELEESAGIPMVFGIPGSVRSIRSGSTVLRRRCGKC